MSEYVVELEVIAGAATGRRFAMSGHETFLVGRSANAHLRLDQADKLISRNHFLIEVNPPRCRLVDLQSNNGTFVNNVRVTSVALNDGDEIRVGKSTLRVTVTLGDATLSHVDEIIDLTQAEVKGEEEDPVPRIDGYEIVRELGKGGMGVVYLARQNGEEIAIKMIRAAGASRAQVARFLREASILERLDHPNIVRFRGMGEADGRPYFAMDYVPGFSAAKLPREGPLSIVSAARIGCQVLRGLEHAHERRFVHRDIKPSNILIGESAGKKVVRIADFGLARIYQASQLSGLTMQGDVGGTVSYMPPEQITDYRNVSPSADQYSTAATLYMLLTGKTVYDFAGSTLAPLVLILQEDPIPIQSRRSEIPDDLAEAIHRGLMREPRHRFANVSDFREALQEFAR